jgi:DNA-directed RNA polymerase specialized sigma24 family protein
VREQRDPLAEVGLVAAARRERLLRVHSFRLRREDLEDCYSQATLELLLRVQRGATFAGSDHLANALEQRFLSRVQDRRRAISGRSPIQTAVEGAHAIGGEVGAVDVADAGVAPEQLVLLRAELRQIAALAAGLTDDQRLVLATQVALGMPRSEFCARYGWSTEKYRKVAQRARARLRRLIDGDAEVARPHGRGRAAGPHATQVRVPGAAAVSENAARQPMRTPPPHHGPAAAAAQVPTAWRADGERRPRDGGRAPDHSPLPGPAARVEEARV